MLDAKLPSLREKLAEKATTPVVEKEVEVKEVKEVKVKRKVSK